MSNTYQDENGDAKFGERVNQKDLVKELNEMMAEYDKLCKQLPVIIKEETNDKI